MMVGIVIEPDFFLHTKLEEVIVVKIMNLLRGFQALPMSIACVLFQVGGHKKLPNIYQPAKKRFLSLL